MRIKIHSGKVRLFFAIPLGFLKTGLGYRIVCQMIRQNSGNSAESCDNPDETAQQTDEQNGACAGAGICETAEPTVIQTESKCERDVQITRKELAEIVSELKRFVKVNGHFNLVEVVSENTNTHIEIRI